MTVTNVCRQKKIGNATFGDSDQLSQTFIVTTDDPLDGPVTVLGVAGDGSPGPDTLPTRGTRWEYGNDSGVQRLTKHVPVRVKSDANGTIWYVACKYERESDEPNGQPNSQGDVVDVPPDEVQAILEPGYRIVSEPIERAIFLGYFDGDGNELDPPGASLVVGDVTPIRNSALIPFVPVPERLVAYQTLTLKKYIRPWNPAFDDAIQKVNSRDYQIQFIDGSGTTIYDRTFEPGTLLLNSINPQQRQFGNEIYYWLDLEFWIDEDGFNKLHANKGLTQIKGNGTSVVEWEPIQNDRGQRLQEPVFLDAKGKVNKTPRDPNTHLYLKYLEYHMYDFDDLNLTY